MAYKFTYNNEEYNYNPENPVPYYNPETENMEYGEKLRDVLGMTDEEAATCHAEGLLNEIRFERDRRLFETDWVGGTDVSDALKAKWNPYRQALRDITETYTSLEDVVWPENPE